MSVVRQTMMAHHPQLKHITAAKDPAMTMEYHTADSWEVEVMRPFFEVQRRKYTFPNLTLGTNSPITNSSPITTS